MCTCICFNLHAQFLKSYTDPASPGKSVSFEAITEQTNASGEFYVGGHIGDTITIFKINTSGTVLGSYKIRTVATNTRIDAIMIDMSGSYAVLIGNIQGANIQGFILKFDITSNSVVWYTETNPADKIYFYDVADMSAANTFYHVSGSNGINFTGLLLRINKNTGALSLGTDYKVQGLEDPNAMQIVGNRLYTTGRYALGGGTAGFRYCFSTFNPTSFAHLGTKYYAVAKPPTATARMYAYDILASGSQAVMVGCGEDNNINDAFKTLQITKVKTSNGSIIWSKKLDITTATSDGSLNEVRLDNAQNYTVMGFTKTAAAQTLNGKTLLLSVNSTTGAVIWNHRYDLYRRQTNNGVAYGYGFAVYGNYIYAVGQDAISGTTKGVLLKVDAATGYLKGTTSLCYDSLQINSSNYTFVDTAGLTFLNPIYKNKKQPVQLNTTVLKDSLVCGVTNTCNCSFTNLVDGGSIFSQTFKCNDTIPMQCNTFYVFHPNLNCGSSVGYLSGATLTDALGNTPAWALPFLSNTGSGSLNIPPSTSGLFTLKYYIGVNGAICDSCTYFLKVSCCPGCLTVKNSQGAKNVNVIVSPNPFTGSFKIEGLRNNTASMDIFSLQGVPLLHYNLVTDGKSFGNNFQKGIYILRLMFKDGTTQRIQIIKN